jgi:hypothetical protein
MRRRQFTLRSVGQMVEPGGMAVAEALRRWLTQKAPAKGLGPRRGPWRSVALMGGLARDRHAGQVRAAKLFQERRL